MAQVTSYVRVEQEFKKFVTDVVEAQHEYYQCKRGPRPSAAMLVLENNRVCRGYVEPTEGSPSCRDVGCEIVYDISKDELDAQHFLADADPQEFVVLEDHLHPHCVRNIHAEVDAIIAAARWGHKTNGAWIFTINKPCYNCAKAIVKAGITKVFYGWAAYDEERTRKVFEAAGVEVTQIHMEEPAWQPC